MNRAAEQAPSPWTVAAPFVTDVPAGFAKRRPESRRSAVTLIADWAARSERGGDRIVTCLKLLLSRPVNLTSLAVAGAQAAARDPDRSTAMDRFWGAILAAADDAERTDRRAYRQIDPRASAGIRATRDDVWLDRLERVMQAATGPRPKLRAASH